MKYDSMSMAHRKVRNLIKAGDTREYKVILAVCLRAVAMMYREVTNADINYLKAMHLNGMVKMTRIQSLHKDNVYYLNFENSGVIRIGHKRPFYVNGRKIDNPY